MMRTTMIFVTVLMLSALLPHNVYTQGWVAEVDLELNHDLYPYERIDEATLTFSGVTVKGNSLTSNLSFVIHGNDPLTGELRLTISGSAWDPYDPSDPPSAPVAATYWGRHTSACTRTLYQGDGNTPTEQVYIWVRIHPRMQVSDFLQTCNELTLTTNTCSSTFLWEVSDEMTTGFRIIPGKQAPTITISREELVSLGFTSPYGRKYFRVTGQLHTTSQLQPVDVYYPGPAVSLDVSQPACHDSSDGSVALSLISPLPDAINDFVVTLFDATSGNPLAQQVLSNRHEITLGGLAHGEYVVRIENNSRIDTYGGCWSDQLFLLKNPEPVTVKSAELSNYGGYHISCAASNDGSISVLASGGTNAFARYHWSPGVGSSAEVRGLTAGTYTVRIEDTNGCWSDEYQYELSEPEPLIVELLSTGGRNGFDVTCHDKSDGSIEVSVTGGVHPFSYMWNDGTETPIRTGMQPGTFSLVVTDSNECMADNTIELVAPAPITFVIEEIQGIICAGDRTGSLRVQSILNSIGPTSVTWSTGETETTVSGQGAGWYTATVSDEQGCSASVNHELSDPPVYKAELTLLTTYNGAAISCHGAQDGQAKVMLYNEAGNSVEGDHYTWYKNGAEFLSGRSDTSIVGIGAGAYRVNVNYHSFCIAEASLLIDDPPSISVGINILSNYNGKPISCAGAHDASVRAFASGGTTQGYQFTWSHGVNDPELKNIGAGTYQVTVRDSNGCTGTAQQEIIEPDLLHAGILLRSEVSCTGESDALLEASASGGTIPYVYAWQHGSASHQILDVPAGSYEMEVTDANGCTAKDTFLLKDPPRLEVFIVDQSDFNGFGVSCYGVSDGYLTVEAIGGTGDYSFVWKDNDSRQTNRSQLRAGSYRAVATDENGCYASVDGVLLEPDRLALRVLQVQDVTCNAGKDGAIQLRADGGAGHYKFALGDLWQENESMEVLKAGTYDLRVQDGNGCESTTTQTIVEPSPITITFTQVDAALCGKPTGRILSSVNGGTPGYVYEWTDAFDKVAGHEKDIEDLPSGVWRLIVHDAHGCETSAETGISSVDGPAVTVARSTSASCSYSADGAATLGVEGEAPFLFMWPDGGTTESETGLKKGSYLVEVSDANECLTVATVNIDGPDPLTIDLIENVMSSCKGQCNGRLSVAARGGNGHYEYQWGSDSGNVIDGLCAGQYTVDVTDEKQCVATTTITLADPSEIDDAEVYLRSPRCPGSCDGKIEVNATGGTGSLHYEWSDGHTSKNIENICSGEYGLTVSDVNGCSSSFLYTVAEAEVDEFDLGDSLVLCKGQTHLLDPGPSWKSYTWGSSTGLYSKARRLTVQEAGVYWLETLDESGCQVRDTFEVQFSDDLLKATLLLPSEAFVMDTIVAIDVTWPVPSAITWILPKEMIAIRNSGDIVYGQFDTPGHYDIGLMATLAECRDTTSKTIRIIKPTAEIDVNGRLGYQPFLNEWRVFPNPSDGVFEITAAFSEATPVILTIFHATSSTITFQSEEPSRHRHSRRIDLRPVSKGTYVIRIDHAKGTAFKRIIIR